MPVHFESMSDFWSILNFTLEQPMKVVKNLIYCVKILNRFYNIVKNPKFRLKFNSSGFQPQTTGPIYQIT